MPHDQCPSTVKGEKQRPSKEQLASAPRTLQRVNGRAAWRSLDEAVDAPEFRDFLEREFPAGMAELVTREAVDLSPAGAARDNESRRDFLKIMGASVALAGAATIPGCRRPDHKIYPYGAVAPEEVIPGKPLFYVTSMPTEDGGALGLLVETHEGRPTKIEGNPLHAHNLGKANQRALAEIQRLYDPDRRTFPVYRNPARGNVPATWDDFRAWATEHFATHAAHQGAGIAFVVRKNASPTRAALRDRLLGQSGRWRNAKWFAYSPAWGEAEFEGTRLAFGRPMRVVPMMTREKTSVILCIDRDLLDNDPMMLPASRQHGATRTLWGPDDPMSRLYVVESGLSATGGSADHRLALPPAMVTAFAVALANFVLPRLQEPGSQAVAGALAALPAAPADTIDRVFLEECAKDLLDAANRGRSAIFVGETQPAPVHALVAALNQALGNVGQSIGYVPVDPETASSGHAALGALASGLRDGSIKTVICVDANPAYDAPGELGLPELLEKTTLISLAVGRDETGALALWQLNQSHFLESWGDTRSADGVIAPIQPMIAPLYGDSMSEIEFLALMASTDFGARVDGYEIVRSVWRARGEWWGGAAGDFDTRWRRALHDGVVPNSAFKAETPAPNFDAIATALAQLPAPAAASPQALQARFETTHVGDGRMANVAWLQELPQYGTKVVWDNPVTMSLRTAEALGVLPVGYSKKDPNRMYTQDLYPHARVAEVTVNGRTFRAPCWVLPGMPDNTATLPLGYGRANAGLVGDGVGVNFYPARTGAGYATGVTIKPTGDTYPISSTQNHWTLDGKDSIIRAVDLPAWRKHAGELQRVVDRTYGTESTLNFAERLGELSHMPPNLSIYPNPFNRSNADADPNDRTPAKPDAPRYANNRPPAYAERPQWAMTIDMGSCTGCGVCTIACQSENNIPVVGKKEVAKHREMHWIRVDRYFTGDDINSPSGIHHQPVCCVHCENAPCEVVCPVNATVHGPEGINYMTYNRCIGTRYCANNCPYKVRRYNWFDYGVKKFNGDYYGKEVVEKVAPDRGGVTGSGRHNKINPNLIPPRLREKLDEIATMGMNPDVTVRSRGVMEKCTFCIQRINFAKHECTLANIRDQEGHVVVPDGFFDVACAQACPTNAITFGDWLDPKSRVHAMRANARSYALLGYLNTRPRVSHMVRVMNPNPEILKRTDKARFEHMEDPFHHGGGGDGHGGEGGRGDDGHGGTGEKPHAYIDSRKRNGDAGYAMSLRVLGGRA
ncbi:MAG TPA: TAT-variant-translocated molybdopterin oxidoreductase [Phycisphaerales bacterium]|nr:TAT-variant-translocated molybdopterin oxidoreductase [Phycisphaerales bacterium]